LKWNWQQGLLVGIILVTCVGFFKPHVTILRPSRHFMFILDISQSMNAKDYHEEGFPNDRLGYAKVAINHVLKELPCGSKIGLGLFTTQNIHILFDPIEVCDHSSVIADTLEHIDWRMAWSADSHIEMGIYHALNELEKNKSSAQLVFMTDGQETPPQTVKPRYDGRNSQKGLILGVGGTRPVAVPRYDRDNNLIGNWENEDIDKAPVSSNVYTLQVETRTLPDTGTYESWLDETHLKEIAAITGLRYEKLDSLEGFVEHLTDDEQAELLPAKTDIRPFLAIIGLVFLLIVYLFEPKSFRKHSF